MANHRRKHPRGKNTRERSSNWVYPQTLRGSAKRARASSRRRAEAAEVSIMSAAVGRHTVDVSGAGSAGGTNVSSSTPDGS